MCESKWQSIETAPKDGTPVLVCDEDGEVLLTRFEQWTHPFTEDALAGFVTGWNSEFNVPESWCSPTHWMPLPSPPDADPCALHKAEGIFSDPCCPACPSPEPDQ